MSVKPITPDEVVDAKIESIPSEVYQVFNKLIVAAWNGDTATVIENVAIYALFSQFAAAGKDVTRAELLASGWLRVEDAYRKVGWRVVYDTPAHNETFEPRFTFSRNGKAQG